MMTIERWLPIRGYEGLYEISDQGRVRSVDRIVTHSSGTPMRRRGRIRKLIRGGLYVDLNRDGLTQTVVVRRLVVEAFGEDAAGCRAKHSAITP